MKVNTIIDNDMHKLIVILYRTLVFIPLQPFFMFTLSLRLPYEIFKKKLFTNSLNLKRLSFILPFGAHQSFFDKVFVIYLTF